MRFGFLLAALMGAVLLKYERNSQYKELWILLIAGSLLAFAASQD